MSDIEQILELSDELEEQERHIQEANKEIERLNNIIKEVREYASEDLRLYDNESIEFEISTKLLEILDKGSDKE